MKYSIGLDIGIASVGWAVINNDKNRIEDLGVRIFKKAEEPDGKALNAVRREARGTRTRIRRRAIRMQKVKELFIKYKLVNYDELKQIYVIDNNTVDVWELRSRGLDYLLERKAWARVLTNIAKRRGYKSNRKIDEEDEKECGKLSKGTMENKAILEQKGYRTIGEMFYKDPKFKFNKRNKGGEYTNTVLRSMLIDEVKILFECQRKYGSKFASHEFEKEFIEVFSYQKPYMTPELLEKMLGKCTFEKEEYRAPKNSYTFERFNLLQKINNLRIDLKGEFLGLSQEDRIKIINLAYEQSKITYYQLRQKLKLPNEARFIGLNYNYIKKNKELTNEERIKEAEKTCFIKLDGWHKIRVALKSDEKFEIIKQNPKIQNIVVDALVRNKTDKDISTYLRDRNIDQAIIDAALKINFTKFGHLSYKAMDKIIPKLEKGLTYDKACTEAGYEFKGAANQMQRKLPPVSQLDDQIILNPVVLRAVSQTRKLINALIDKYDSPMAIYIETAGELAKSYEDRKIIERKQKENFQTNEKLMDYIRENFKIEPKPFDLVKVKLWREQGEKCAYSMKPILAERLFEENYVQIDHVIPFSRCFNDSYNNKVLVLTQENQNKREKTPYEYFGDNKERWHRFEEFVNVVYRNNLKKKENLLMKEFNEEKAKQFIDRNLNDTRYIAKFMYNYISKNLKFSESDLKRKVYTINGQATSTLRHYWGLKKDREKSDKHHAQDAIVIACATMENIKKISEYSKRKILYLNNNDEKYNPDLFVKEPWINFRQEVEARMANGTEDGKLYALINGKFDNYDDIDVEKIKPIFVSRMPERKVTGKAHKDTMRSMKFIKKGKNFTVVKKNITSITKQEIEDIINNPEYKELYIADKIMYDDIFEKMKENDFNSQKAFVNGYRKYSKKGNAPIVRSVKVPSAGKVGVKLKNGAIAENANMVRVDVFNRNNKHYLVPIYVSDFVKKELPNKAIVAHKDEEQWIDMDERYEFKFSLYPNDLIKIKKKNEKEEFVYYISAHRGTGAINFISHDGSKEGSAGAQNLETFEKYQVDVLGNIFKINKEKREGVK